MDDLFATQGFAWGEGKTIEPLQLFGDAATLQQYCLPRHLRGMGGEYRSHGNLAKRRQRGFGGHAGLLHAQQCSMKRSRQRGGLPIQLPGAAPPFAVISLRQVGQLEINGEGLRDVISAVHIHS